MAARPLTVIDCDGSPAAVHAVSTGLARALEEPAGPAVLPVVAAPAAARSGVLAALRPGDPVDERVALVLATSGSSGRPKGVELAAAALLASARATHERLGGPGRWLLALPVQHVAGVQVLVRSLVAGYPPAVLDLRGGFDAAAFAAAAASLPAGRRYTALVPTQLLRLLDASGTGRSAGVGDADGASGRGGGGAAGGPGSRGNPGGAAVMALLGFDAVLVGGAACPPALLARARGAGIPVVTSYGMTETAGGCVYGGRPLRGTRVRIGAARPDGSGRIELAGPTLAAGYRLGTASASRAATAAAFCGGWFQTGDLGRLDPDGRLEVLGRLDDVIVTGGLKVAPAAVEAALVAERGVAEACVVGIPDAEWGELVAAAVVARDPASPPEPAALRSAARALAGASAVPRLIRLLPELPRTGPGKIDRAAVRALLAGPRPEVT